MPDRIFPILFTAQSPVSAETLVAVLDASEDQVLERLESLRRRIKPLGLVLHERRLGYELATAPDKADLIRRARKLRPPRRLTPAAKETLFLIMRRGPITRRLIQQIRGVEDVSPVLRTLRAEGLIAKAGHVESLGRPLLYKATEKARERFPGLDEAVKGLLGQGRLSTS